MKFANPSKKARTVASTRGHTINFPGRGSPGGDEATGFVFVNVPPALNAEVIAAGLIPESELQDEPEHDLPVAPLELAERELALFNAYGKLVERGNREDFAGNGSPRVDALTTVLGWKPDAKENRNAWQAYQTREKD